jgi:DNA-binding NarL/FixJ family response regulator
MVAGLESSSELTIESCAGVREYEAVTAPHLVLLQVSGPATEFTALAAQVTLASIRWPSAAALIVSDHVGSSEILAAIRAGAQGLLTSNASVDCIRSAIADLLRLGVTEVIAAPAPPPQRVEPGRLTTLTRRQREVVQLLALGFSNRMIAERLKISESTVKVHIRAIMAQNGASNRTQIVAHFLASIPQ